MKDINSVLQEFMSLKIMYVYTYTSIKEMVSEW